MQFDNSGAGAHVKPEPSPDVISQFLYAMFPPEFVDRFPASRIEIMHGRPGEKRLENVQAATFLATDIKSAVEYAVRQSMLGRNVYAGTTLKRPETPPFGRTNDTDFLAANAIPGDWDGAGEVEAAAAKAKELGLEPYLAVRTGSVPHDRGHMRFLLSEHITDAKVYNAAADALQVTLGSDKMIEPSRVVRCAGTVNYPTGAKARERHYVIEPTEMRTSNGAKRHAIADMLKLASATAEDPTKREDPRAEEDAGDNFFRNVNTAAMANLSAWVPALFPAARHYQDGYRVSSESLGRELDEDLSILPKGIKDFGVHDMGDPRSGKRTPIDLVMQYGAKLSPTTAANWLCERLGVTPEAMGWDSSADTADTAASEAEAAARIEATPFVWCDPKDIPMRDWVYGAPLLREFLTVTVASGGLGKSSLTIVEALAMVTGKPLVGIQVKEPLRVWMWNLEDPYVEIRRKIQAAMIYYKIKPEDLGDRLYINSGRDTKLVVATVDPKTGAKIARPVVDALIAEAKRRKIDALMVDPYVSSHQVPENDNNGQDMIAKEWSMVVAGLGKCAVHLVHHTRKQGADAEVTAESARGAKAITDAARIVRVVNQMTEEEAKKAGVEHHRRYFRTYNDKANLAPPAEESEWFHLESVDLPNGPLGTAGDNMGVVKQWEWPDYIADLTAEDWEKCAVKIKAGKWRDDFRSPAWVGYAVGAALEIDTTSRAGRAKVKAIVGYWIKAGSLVRYEDKDERRETRTFVKVAEDD